MNRRLRFLILTVGIPALLLALAAPAAADPSRAPNLAAGTADCGPDGTVNFVVNQSNSDSQSWSPAFLIRSDGARGLFIPSSIDLTFTTPEGSFGLSAQKGATSGAASCEIFSELAPGVTVTGTVTGTIIWTG
jgi:hypothetical protein